MTHATVVLLVTLLLPFASVAAFIVRVEIVRRATLRAIEESFRLQDAAYERGENWQPYADALDIHAAYRWRVLLHPMKWRYSDFYPELARLAEEVGK